MHPLPVGQVGERRLEREREQEAGEDLRAGLQHAQLLQHLDPVAVGALRRALVATVDAVVARIGVAVRGHAPSLRSRRRDGQPRPLGSWPPGERVRLLLVTRGGAAR